MGSPYVQVYTVAKRTLEAPTTLTLIVRSRLCCRHETTRDLAIPDQPLVVRTNDPLAEVRKRFDALRIGASGELDSPRRGGTDGYIVLHQSRREGLGVRVVLPRRSFARSETLRGPEMARLGARVRCCKHP